MRNVLIASGSFSDLCRLITGTLRPQLGSGRVSYYYGEELARLCKRDQFDLSDFGFLILRLSPHSHQKDSETYNIESNLVDEAIRRRIPIGIVCDPTGKITAPYIDGEKLSHVVLVVTNDTNEGCSAQELYQNAGIFDLGLGGQSIAEVSAFITRQLPAAPSHVTQPQVTRSQMAASNSPQSNYTD